MIQVPETIKTLLHNDKCQKNIRIHFPNGERSDICNDLIVKDSVSFTESLCSQSELKFGLCESPVFECEVVGVGNIKGATIEVSCEIIVKPYWITSPYEAVFRPDLEEYVFVIPYGVFTVDSCQRQADMIHRKIIAYNYMMSNPNRVDPIIDFKAGIPFSTQKPYQPNIIATSLNNFGAKTRINGATYTRSGYSSERFLGKKTYPISSGHELLGDIDFGLLLCRKMSQEIDPDALFYIEYNLTQNPQDTLADVCNQAMTDEYFPAEKVAEAIEDIKKDFPKIDVSKIWRGCSYNSYNVPFTDSGYIYTYQIEEDETIRNGVDVIVGCYIRVRNNLQTYIQYYKSYFLDPSDDSESLQVYDVDISSFPEYRLYVPRDINVSIPDRLIYGYGFDRESIDYYQTLKDSMELFGLFWYTTREGGVQLLNIKQQFGLTPSTSLYPGNGIYPEGVTGGKLLPEDYQSCWYDDEYTKPFGAVVCDYKDTNNQEQRFTLYLQGYNSDVDVSTYQIYELSGNGIIDGALWTQAQIESICNTIANNISGVRYMPVEFTGRGLPYVEAGDTFEILTKSNDSITTIVLHRTLTGDQTLTDTYKSV